MAQISIINIKDIIQAKRFDAEYFKPEYLEIERKIKSYYFQSIYELAGNNINYGLNIDPIYTKHGINFIRAQNLKEYGFDGEILKIPYSKNDFSQKELLFEGDLIIVRSGANVGDIGITTKEFENSTFGSYIIKIDLKDKINPYFVYIFLKTKFGKKQTIRFRSGTAQPNISIPNLNEVLIPILDISFQQQIKYLFFEAKEKQSLSKELYKQAEHILLEELDLIDFKPKHKLTFTTTKKEIDQAKRFDAEYFQPKYEEIIEKIKSYKGGFEKLENFIVDYSTGYPFKSESYQNTGFPLIRINNIGKGNLDIENVAFIPEKDKNLSLKDVAKEDDILISMSGTIGNSCKIPKNVEAVVNQRIFRFTPKKFDPDVLSLFINSIMGYSQLIRIGTGGVQTNISSNDIIKILIPLVPNYIQQKISQKIQESFKLRKEAKELLEKAKKMVEEEIEKANPKQNV